jgi:NIPSNAP
VDKRERVLIYEIRIYEAAEGRADAMRRRFCDHVATKFFPRHGIELVGAFAAPAEDGRLTYMTRFTDEDARKKAWAAFGADPEWLALKAASETEGPLLKNQVVSVLSPAMTGLPLG